jgi:hypothetical protein
VSTVFNVAGAWQMRSVYDCTVAKTPDFHVAVHKAGGKHATAHDLHLRTRSGSRTDRYQRGGSFYLLVHSPCRWEITVVGTPPKPKPTTTPQVPYTVQAAAQPCVSDTLQKGCADLGFTITASKGTVTLTQKTLGYTIQVSKFGIAPESYGNGYMLVMDVKATKSTPANGSLTPWNPSAQSFSLIAANGHPYQGLSCGNPPFSQKSVYNGESNEGFVCSEAIDPAYVATSFTWSFSGYGYIGASSSYVSFRIPMVTVTVTHR